MDPAGPTARRFPLVARARPACTPLPQRVADLCARARTAERDNDMASAAAVHNLAALLASDCGLPELARHWCHRQADVYLRAHPLDALTACYALEPLINLARPHTRAGEGDRAYELVQNLFTAVSSRNDSTIDGIEIPAAHLTLTTEAHHQVCKWLWATLLATGARALAAAGRWEEARARLHEHHGIGQRMLDGRQVAVLARATAGDTDDALTLCRTTQPGDPWENTVTACLTLLCRKDTSTSRSLIDLYQSLDTSARGLAVFHVRLGLSAIDALGGVEHRAALSLAAQVIQQAREARDGYAARDVLHHDGRTFLLRASERRELTETVASCSLGQGYIPGNLRGDLERALGGSTAVLRRTLAAKPS
ncbi:hypothetical protein [Streptomyces sp. NPDC003077]|uniref:hypothetical protein n=1 Tax=Streptomyces sp. NPDC003077 TaxID=3154443 RepID=UPI0033A0C362